MTEIVLFLGEQSARMAVFSIMFEQRGAAAAGLPWINNGKPNNLRLWMQVCARARGSRRPQGASGVATWLLGRITVIPNLPKLWATEAMAYSVILLGCCHKLRSCALPCLRQIRTHLLRANCIMLRWIEGSSAMILLCGLAALVLLAVTLLQVGAGREPARPPQAPGCQSGRCVWVGCSGPSHMPYFP